MLKHTWLCNAEYLLNSVHSTQYSSKIKCICQVPCAQSKNCNRDWFAFFPPKSPWRQFTPEYDLSTYLNNKVNKRMFLEAIILFMINSNTVNYKIYNNIVK